MQGREKGFRKGRADGRCELGTLRPASVRSNGGMALRIAAKRTQDGSIDYAMGFDDEKQDDDRIETLGINIVIAILTAFSPHWTLYLLGRFLTGIFQGGMFVTGGY